MDPRVGTLYGTPEMTLGNGPLTKLPGKDTLEGKPCKGAPGGESLDWTAWRGYLREPLVLNP